MKTAPRSRENTRGRLIDAAQQVFGEIGLDAASVELICERAGFTRGAFYSNFASKDELLLALMERLTAQTMTRVADRVRDLDDDAARDPMVLVRDVVGASMSGTMEPGLANEIRAQALRSRPLAEAYLRWRDGLIARVEDIVREVADRYALALRLPADEVARLLVEVADDTGTRAALQGRDAAALQAALAERLARTAGALID